MSNTAKTILTIVIALVVVGGGVYLYITRPVAAPSEPIQQAADEMMDDRMDSNAFHIVPEESEVSFTLGEVLRGVPTTVVGATNQVAGTITFNPDEADAASAGDIIVNARTLLTDEPQRNGAIARLILESEKSEYEYITFTPTDVLGMPATVAPGDSFNVRVNGRLKIRDITKDVSFTGSATRVNDVRLAISMEAVVNRADFNLVIPNIPFVANVDEQVTLKARLVAVKSSDNAMMPDEGMEGEMMLRDADAAGQNHGEGVMMDDDMIGGDAMKDDGSMMMDPTEEPGSMAAIREITVTGSPFKFEPSALTVKKGQKVRVTFESASGNHDFVIDELGVATKRVGTGGQDVVEFTPNRAGTFSYYCSVGNHRAMGMEGTITVTE